MTQARKTNPKNAGVYTKEWLSLSFNNTMWMFLGSEQPCSLWSCTDPGSFHLVDLPSPWAMEFSAFIQQREKEGEALPVS